MNDALTVFLLFANIIITVTSTVFMLFRLDNHQRSIDASTVLLAKLMDEDEHWENLNPEQTFTE